MKDQIEREDAIEVVKRQRKISWKNWHETRPSAERIIEDLKELPSAQSTMGQVFDGDAISRRAAIDAVLKESNTDGAYGYMDTKSIVDLLNEQPPAQPDYTAIKSEIITNIEEFNDAKHHAQWVQDNGKMIAFGLELALRIVEEKER